MISSIKSNGLSNFLKTLGRNLQNVRIRRSPRGFVFAPSANLISYSLSASRWKKPAFFSNLATCGPGATDSCGKPKIASEIIWFFMSDFQMDGRRLLLYVAKGVKFSVNHNISLCVRTHSERWSRTPWSRAHVGKSFRPYALIRANFLKSWTSRLLCHANEVTCSAFWLLRPTILLSLEIRPHSSV